MAHDPHLGADLNGVLDDLEDANVKADVNIKKAIKLSILNDFHRDPSCTTCTEPGCCYQATYEPLSTAFPIARELRTSGRDTPELRAQLKAAGEEMESTEREKWFQDAHPCVFLKDKRCSIYDLRPMCCRQYTVFTPAEHCSPGAGKMQITSLSMSDVQAHHINLSHAFHVMLGLKENKRRVLVGSLPRIVYLVLEALDMPYDKALEFIRHQPWPTVENMEAWIHAGQSPFRDQRG